jgi:pSer/pThr/pTyr-binding forkhead associated (FHA) protein
MAASAPSPALMATSEIPLSQQPTGAMSAVVLPSPARGRLVIIARDGGEGPAFPLGEITDIGRTEGNVVIAEDRYVSPRHARIERRGRDLMLRDLGSVNGIYLRIPSALGIGSGGGAHLSSPPHGQVGASVMPPAQAGLSSGASPGIYGSASPPIEVPLLDQDLFLIGQQVLRFEVVKGAEEGFGTASQHGTLLFGTPAAPRYARVSQRTVEGVTRDVFYIRKVETVLGRESGDIVFTEDPFLSRRHAVLRVDVAAKRFTLADLGSSNGTFVQIREEVALKDGDHFRVGQQLFRVDVDAPHPYPAAARA